MSFAIHSKMGGCNHQTAVKSRNLCSWPLQTRNRGSTVSRITTSSFSCSPDFEIQTIVTMEHSYTYRERAKERESIPIPSRREPLTWAKFPFSCCCFLCWCFLFWLDEWIICLVYTCTTDCQWKWYGRSSAKYIIGSEFYIWKAKFKNCMIHSFSVKLWQESRRYNFAFLEKGFVFVFILSGMDTKNSNTCALLMEFIILDRSVSMWSSPTKGFYGLLEKHEHTHTYIHTHRQRNKKAIANIACHRQLQICDGSFQIWVLQNSLLAKFVEFGPEVGHNPWYERNTEFLRQHVAAHDPS